MSGALEQDARALGKVLGHVVPAMLVATNISELKATGEALRAE